MKEITALPVAEITPLPWELHAASMIVKFGEDWACIAQVCNPRSKTQPETGGHKMEPLDCFNPRAQEGYANAAYIVTACNSYQQMREALQKAIGMENDRRAGCQLTDSDYADLYQSLQAALSEKEG